MVEQTSPKDDVAVLIGRLAKRHEAQLSCLAYARKRVAEASNARDLRDCQEHHGDLKDLSGLYGEAATALRTLTDKVERRDALLSDAFELLGGVDDASILRGRILATLTKDGM